MRNFLGNRVRVVQAILAKSEDVGKCGICGYFGVEQAVLVHLAKKHHSKKAERALRRYSSE